MLARQFNELNQFERVGDDDTDTSAIFQAELTVGPRLSLPIQSSRDIGASYNVISRGPEAVADNQFFAMELIKSQILFSWTPSASGPSWNIS